MTKKLISLLTICLLFTSCLYGCGNEKETNPTTTEAEVTTEKETITKTEVTIEEPTTKKEPPTKYVYKGKKFAVDKSLEKYFTGLILEKGDVIYVNDLYPEESAEYDSSRGSVANAILITLKMQDEEEELRNKYWPDGAFSPAIPYKDNYCIKYSGEKVEYVLVEKASDGIFFDIIPVE